MRLSIIALGDVHAEHLVPLTYLFEHIEQLVLDVPPRDALSKHRAELNRALDAASADWILILRERENVTEAAAKEIFEAASGGKARGFRIRSVPMYSGEVLTLGHEDGGEVRLFHRRSYLRFADKGEWREINIQGTVVRLGAPLQSLTFETAEQHVAHLRAIAAPHSALRRLLLFFRYVLGTKTTDRNTLRYLWIEAGYDVPSKTN